MIDPKSMLRWMLTALSALMVIACAATQLSFPATPAPAATTPPVPTAAPTATASPAPTDTAAPLPTATPPAPSPTPPAPPAASTSRNLRVGVRVTFRATHRERRPQALP